MVFVTLDVTGDITVATNLDVDGVTTLDNTSIDGTLTQQRCSFCNLH